MPPLPKRKYASARRGDRRSHLAMTAPTLTECPNCRQPRLTHQACQNCGQYRGRQVIDIRTAREPS
ncbi:MAG: 50S ribosomal protein L32 [Chloroflexota bacterium]|nr:MAG: 50S ribosomal protein L32 [Chloroflexota bacterium]